MERKDWFMLFKMTRVLMLGKYFLLVIGVGLEVIKNWVRIQKEKRVRTKNTSPQNQTRA